MKKLRNIALALLLLFSTSLIASEDYVGIVVASRGNVHNHDNESISQGNFIYLNDVIITENRSFVVIQLTDGSKITVRPDSTLKIDSYAFNGTDGDQLNLDLIQGGLRIVSGSIAKTSPENYTINTPVALMGVRGTEFSIMFCGKIECPSD